MLTNKQIIKHLKTVMDPELQINIVDMGLIYDVKISDNGAVVIKMTLTSPGCPLSYVFQTLVEKAILKIKDVRTVKVKLVFDPPWDSSKMTKKAKLQLGWL